jgi:hypothetical protein
VADDHRKHEQPVFVDQPRGDQRLHELRAARGDDVAAWRLLQRLRLVDEGTAQHGGVLPPGVVQRAGDHVLVHRVQVVRHPGRVVRLGGPESAEDLECVAAHEQRVGGLSVLGVRRGDVGLVDVLVERIEPPLRHVDHAVERDVLRYHQLAHRTSCP